MPKTAQDKSRIACRFCGAANNVPVEAALRDLSKPKCGRCKEGLFRVAGEPLTDVTVEALAHPWDREALAKLKAIPYADELLAKALGGTLDKLTRFNFLAGAVEVGERQAPSLLRLYLQAAGRLDIDPPPLYIVQTPVMNAYTSGASKPIVAVTTGLLDGMDDQEVLAVLGHELTHVKLGHVLYRTLAQLLAVGGLGILSKFLGIASVLAMPLRLALARWYQMAELSADRGELVATGSLEVCVRTHMLLAGGSRRLAADLDVGAFIDQADRAEAMRDTDLLVYVMDMLNTAQRSHPLPAWRVHHVLAWARSPEFLQLMAGSYKPVLEHSAS